MEKVLTQKDFETPAAKAQEKIVKFTNFTDEDFTWTWNKRPWTFKAGQFMFLEQGIANHFAKHLVNRELIKEGRDTDTSPKKPEDNAFFMELYNKCIEVLEGGNSDPTKLEQEIIDRNTRAKLGLDQPESASEAKTEEKVEEGSNTNNNADEEFEEVPVPDEEEDEPAPAE